MRSESRRERRLSRFRGAVAKITAMRILIADDEQAVREALGRALTAEGYEVAFAGDGDETLLAVERDEPDAAVLDVMMPPPDGLEVCRRLRAADNTIPILMLTAKREVSDRVAGLDAGADDYLAKPFALDELLARLRALLRRVPNVEGRLEYADVVVDPSAHLAWRAGARLTLTRTEFALLELFLRSPERVLSRSAILVEVWGFDFGPTSNSLEVYVGYLRRKMEESGRATAHPHGARRRLRPPERAVTLSRRVVLATSAAMGAVIVLLSVFTYLLVKRELYSRVDVTLRDRATELAPTVEAGRASFREIIVAPGEYVQMLSANGQSVRPPYQVTRLPSGRAERAIAAGSGSLTETTTIGGERARVFTTHVGRGVALQVTRPLADDDATLSRLRLILAIVAVCAVLLAVLIGGWIAERALAPVRRLTKTAEEVARTRDLSIRLDEDGHDEVSRLGAAFNQMLVALDRSLTAQRQLVADASHEFRTPLTSIRANAELLERGKVREDEQDAVARAVVEQVDELDGLVTDLIELALDGEAATKFEDVRLDEIVSIEVDRLRRNLTGATFDVKSEPCMVQGDAERLSRAVANVLGNAVKWSPEGASVDVSVARGSVVVRDHGPGIDEADLPLVFERFYRSPAARGTAGSGLGLAIVRHVVEAHGGSVEATNAPDGGAVFTLRFPVSP